MAATLRHDAPEFFPQAVLPQKQHVSPQMQQRHPWPSLDLHELTQSFSPVLATPVPETLKMLWTPSTMAPESPIHATTPLSGNGFQMLPATLFDEDVISASALQRGMGADAATSAFEISRFEMLKLRSSCVCNTDFDLPTADMNISARHPDNYVSVGHTHPLPGVYPRKAAAGTNAAGALLLSMVRDGGNSPAQSNYTYNFAADVRISRDSPANKQGSELLTLLRSPSHASPSTDQQPQQHHQQQQQLPAFPKSDRVALPKSDRTAAWKAPGAAPQRGEGRKGRWQQKEA